MYDSPCFQPTPPPLCLPGFFILDNTSPFLLLGRLYGTGPKCSTKPTVFFKSYTFNIFSQFTVFPHRCPIFSLHPLSLSPHLFQAVIPPQLPSKPRAPSLLSSSTCRIVLSIGPYLLLSSCYRTAHLRISSAWEASSSISRPLRLTLRTCFSQISRPKMWYSINSSLWFYLNPVLLSDFSRASWPTLCSLSEILHPPNLQQNIRLYKTSHISSKIY